MYETSNHPSLRLNNNYAANGGGNSPTPPQRQGENSPCIPYSIDRPTNVPRTIDVQSVYLSPLPPELSTP